MAMHTVKLVELLRLIGTNVNIYKNSKSFHFCSKSPEMVRQKNLSQTFRSVKPRPDRNPSLDPPKLSSQSPLQEFASLPTPSGSKTESKPWSVYLILSTNPPIKTYVGVTNNFTRRLKQHNGELKGGAKASRAGRPWVCACLIHGFKNQSEGCEFESKWKITCKKLSRKREEGDQANKADSQSLTLLQHRQAALNRVKDLFDFNHLEIDWRIDTL